MKMSTSDSRCKHAHSNGAGNKKIPNFLWINNKMKLTSSLSLHQCNIEDKLLIIHKLISVNKGS